MKKILKFIWIIGIFLLWGCAKTVYVPAETIYKTEVRDSIIKITDTLRVEVPKEVIKEVLPIIDTSRLETKVAQSIAYVDTLNRKLIHKLENKPSFNTKIDTIVKVVYKTEYLEKPVITEVEKEIPYVPTFAWICIIYSILSIGIKIYRLFRNVI